MKKRIGLALISVAGITISCAGGDGSSAATLQQADIEQISNGVLSGLASISNATSSAGTSTALVAANGVTKALSVTANVNTSAACPVDGHVTTRGNVYVSCPTPPATGACTLSGAININFGDRTNNLNDCTFSNGLVIDGTVLVTLTGTGNGTAVTMTETLTGHLELDRKGPSGGLVPLDSCWVFLTAKVPERTVTGTVCGHPVNKTF